MSKNWLLILLSFLAAGIILGLIVMIKPGETPIITPTPIMPTTTVTPTQVPAGPVQVIKPNTEYTVVLNTSQGKISILLDTTGTPITANNFVYLAQKGFYNSTIFHRVINGFMIQGGDPKGDGTGNPGYKFADEPFTGTYTRGTVAMANSGPNTNGSQFFIMHQNNNLPPSYVIFGHVTAGLDIVDKIATASVSANAMGEMSKPVSPVVVNSINILTTP